MGDVIVGAQGKVVVSIRGAEVGESLLTIVFSDLTKLTLWHEQDCCEHVSIEEIIGNPKDLIGQRLEMAEVETEDGNDEFEYSTWTFYKFRCHGGDVTIRWLGSSNGYYSERVTESIEPVTIFDLSPEEQVMYDKLLEQGR